MKNTTDTKVTRADIAREIASVHGISYNKSLEVVDTVFNYMRSELESGSSIEIRGFGSFLIKKRNRRPGMNMKSGEKIDIPEHNTVIFKPGVLLKDNFRRQAEEK